MEMVFYVHPSDQTMSEATLNPKTRMMTNCVHKHFVPNGSNILVLLTRERVRHNKGGHCPFRKSQLDSRTFGMVGLMGLWPHYHLGGLVWCALNLTNKRI